MYDSSANRTTDRDTKFQNILGNAADTIYTRLRRYENGHDPIERSRLKLLYDIVSLEIEKVVSGMADTYSGLSGPMKAVQDWGEPADSELVTALRDAEMFYIRNYSAMGGRSDLTSH